MDERVQTTHFPNGVGGVQIEGGLRLSSSFELRLRRRRRRVLARLWLLLVSVVVESWFILPLSEVSRAQRIASPEKRRKIDIT